MRPTRALINLSNLSHNIGQLKALATPETVYMAVVKADAYGHGLLPVARHCLISGAGYLGVALPEEGALLREAGIAAPILVFGAIDHSQAETVVQFNLTQSVSSLETLTLLKDAALHTNKIVPIHIKLDTGMGRIGLRGEKDLISFLEALKGCPNILPEGVFTHFACADHGDLTYTQKQLLSFQNLLAILKAHNVHPRYRHTSNSAGILHFKASHYDMIRGGISMYGYDPAGLPQGPTESLRPVLSLTTRIVHLKTIEAGESVSYGRTYTAAIPTKVATLPIGYADGYPRLLSNQGWTLIGGQKAPILGRVCMDQIMVDVTTIPDASVGDEAVLLGSQGNASITADDIANICGTISYEILTGIRSRVPREYTGGLLDG